MNICIVEDDEAEMDNLLTLFKRQPDINVINSFANAEDALAAAAQWKKIDVLIVDLDLPGMSGIGLIQRACQLNPAMRAIVHTIHDDRPSLIDAVKAGACGYIIKGCPSKRIVPALREIIAGGAPMSPSIARAVLNELQTRGDIPLKSGAATGPVLSMRECTILRLLERAFSYKEIASQLSITPSTVHSHIKNIYTKLHAHGKQDAIRKGRYHNLI